MTPELTAQFERIPFLGQRQDGTMDQLRDLVPFVRKLGLPLAVERMENSLSNYNLADNSRDYAGSYPERLRGALAAIDELEVSNLSERAQFAVAQSFASKLGLYDAADLLRMLAEHSGKFLRPKF